MGCWLKPATPDNIFPAQRYSDRQESPMYIFRPVTVADYRRWALAAQSLVGSPRCRPTARALLHKIQASQDALAAEVRLHGEERYFFTVEDRASGRLLGLSGWWLRLGITSRFTAFATSC